MARTLRLLVVGVSWPLETFLSRLVRGLLAAGIEVTVACANRPDPAWMMQPGFRWVRIWPWKGSGLLRLVRIGTQTIAACCRDWRGTANVFAGMKRAHEIVVGEPWRLSAWNRAVPFAGRRWDVVYFPWNIAAIEQAWFLESDSPVVISCRGSQVNVAPHNPHRSGVREGLRYTLARAAAVHCVSHAMKEEISRYAVDTARVRIIHPAVDPTFFRPAERRQCSDEFRLVTVGTLIWHKGYEYALQAIRQLVDRDIPIHMDVIGAGPERQRVLFTVEDLGLQDRIHVVGKLPPREVLNHLQNADVFLLSSLTEGISNAVLEAMACGLPVVTTDCGGMREAVTDGVEGIVVPMRAPDDIATALESLWHDPKRRIAMGTAGRRRIERDFSLDRQIREFVELFSGVHDAGLSGDNETRPARICHSHQVTRP